MNKYLFSLSLIILIQAAGCSDVKGEEKETLKIETASGTVTAESTTVDPIPQTITPVTGDELSHLLALSDPSRQFLYSYVEPGVEPTLEAYDLAFKRWRTSKSTTKFTDEKVTEILGGILGNRCVADLNMEWVIVTDRYGTDYAVRSREREVMAFPFSTALKRIESGENDFMFGVFETIKHMLKNSDVRKR